MITDGPYVGTKEFLGASAVVDVADDGPPRCGRPAWVGRVRALRGVGPGGGEVEWASEPSDLRDL